jgi:hypothetical protein
MTMIKDQITQLRFIIIPLLFAGLMLGCSSGNSGETNENWEVYSASKNKDKSGIDYSRPGDATIKDGGFKSNVTNDLKLPADLVSTKMFQEYGAMFVAKNGVIPPNKVVFNNEAEVSAWQQNIAKSTETIGGITIELQTPAMNALKSAVAEAKQSNLAITPRGTDAARRDYNGTVELWKSRVDPGLKHWVGKGRLPKAEADRIASLPAAAQIPEIFKLESQGMYFSTDRSKSIIYSVAPPGTSQHISMLALDVTENDDPQIRQILAKYGWFQTVISDAPHFTYIGVKETDLPRIGLKKVSNGNRSYWIPGI